MFFASLQVTHCVAQFRIMERAYALRDAREKERAKFVQEKYNEQWRDACDDARTLDSKAMTKHMNKERIAQIQDKIKRKEQTSSQENYFLDEWNRQLEELERRDIEKQQLRRRIDNETSNEIKAQILQNAQNRENHFYERRREEEEELARVSVCFIACSQEMAHFFLSQLRSEIDADEALQKKRHDDAYRRGREVLQFNALNKSIKDSEAHIEKDHDAILLDYALRKEQEANAAEEAKRNANRQASMQYRKYLEEQMVKEAEDTAFVDEVRKREEEKVWKLRDDALQARQDARDYLMREVDAGRQVQISAKRELTERERLEGQRFAAKFIDEAHDAVQREKLAAERRRQVAVDNNERLLHQIDYRRQKEELEKQEAYLADKQMKYIERQHQQRLAEQGGAIRSFRPLQKNSWYS